MPSDDGQWIGIVGAVLDVADEGEAGGVAKNAFEPANPIGGEPLFGGHVKVKAGGGFGQRACGTCAPAGTESGAASDRVGPIETRGEDAVTAATGIGEFQDGIGIACSGTNGGIAETATALRTNIELGR